MDTAEATGPFHSGVSLRQREQARTAEPSDQSIESHRSVRRQARPHARSAHPTPRTSTGPHCKSGADKVELVSWNRNTVTGS